MSEPVLPSSIIVLSGAAGIATAFPQLTSFFVIALASVCGAAMALSVASRDDDKRMTRLQAVMYIITTLIAALLTTVPISMIVEALVPALKHEYTGSIIALFFGARREQIMDRAVFFKKSDATTTDKTK